MNADADPKLTPLDVLVAEYVEAAELHGRAMEAGDHLVANSTSDRVAAVYRELRRRGKEVLDEGLLPLLDHPDPGVRSVAGTHALEFAPAAGEKALNDLVAGGGMAGINAERALEVWKDGTLRFS